jgi:predicted amidohydrolase YtcJ
MGRTDWCAGFFLGQFQHLSCFLQGPERVKNLYAFRNMIDSGARITLGTDFPVEEVQPLTGFVAAVTRTANGKSPHGPGGWCVILNVIIVRYILKLPSLR